MAMHPAEKDGEHIRGQRQCTPRPSVSPAVCSHCSFSGDLMNAVSPHKWKPSQEWGIPCCTLGPPSPAWCLADSREDL